MAKTQHVFPASSPLLQEVSSLATFARKEAGRIGQARPASILASLEDSVATSAELSSFLRSTEEGGARLVERLDAPGTYFQSYTKWIERETATRLEPVSLNPVDAWHRRCDSETAAWPPSLALPIATSLLTPNRGDAIATRWGRAVLSMKVRRGKQRFFSEALLFRAKVQARVGALLFTLDLTMRSAALEIITLLRSEIERFKDELLAMSALEDEGFWGRVKTSDLVAASERHLQRLSELPLRLRRTMKQAVEETCAAIETVFEEYAESTALAGTFLLPRRRYSRRFSQRRMKKAARSHAHKSAAWTLFEIHSLSEWSKELKLIDLQVAAAKYYFDALEIIERKRAGKLKPLIDETMESLGRVSARLEEASGLSAKELRTLIKAENRQLLRELRERHLPSVSDAFSQANFEGAFESLLNRIQKELEAIPHYSIITKQRIKDLGVRFRAERIAVGELLDYEIIEDARGQSKAITRAVDERLQAMKRKIANLDEIVQYNLETAVNLLDSEDGGQDESARESAVQGLDRTSTNIEDIRADLDETLAIASAQFGEMARDLQRDIQELSETERVIQLKIRLARAQAGQKIRELATAILTKVWRALPRLFGLLRSGVQRVRRGYSKVRKLSGLSADEGHEERQLSDFIELNRRKIKRLPFIYQRIFGTDPLDDQRFFVGRAEQIRMLNESFGRFKDGFSVTAVIVGERGNGKTTILNYAEAAIYRGSTTIRVDFPRTFFTESGICGQFALSFGFGTVQSFETLEKRLNELEGKQVIVLENIQNTFLRTVTGFDALERLLQLITRLEHRHYWLATSGIYGWNYLDRTIGISGYFRDIVRLPPLSIGEIRGLIEVRHAVSGYGLHFLVPEKAEKTRAFRRLGNAERRQAWLADMFFKRLTELAHGNIRTALMFWLSAIDSHTAEDIVIDPALDLDPSFIYQLPMEEVFTLAAFAHHEFLTPSEHALVFRQSVDTSDLLLRRMRRKGLIDVSDESYFVQPFVYRAVIRGLQMKNILE